MGYPTYDPESDIEAAKAGDRAAQGRITSHMTGACKQTARAYSKKYQYLGYDDLVQEGYMAVLRAVKKWDRARDTKFTTYAFQAIRNRAWIMARRTKFLHQLVDSRVGIAGDVAGQNGLVGGSVDARVVLEGLAVDHRGDSAEKAVEKFAGLSADHCRVLLARLQPVMEGRPARAWAIVGRIEGLPASRCRELYAEAVELVRKAHGED